MGKESLTAKEVQHAKPGDKRVEIPAGPPAGLYLVVHPTGKKGWALRYRWCGKTRNLTFSKSYPDMVLATARAEAQAKLNDLGNGIDPAAVQAQETKQSEPNSAEAVAGEWLLRTMKQKSSQGEVRRILDREILKPWKHKLITDISRPDIFSLLDATVDRGAPVLANRMLTIIKRWLKWCVNRGYIPFSPAAGIDPPAEEEGRERVLTVEELKEIWNAAPSLGFPFGDYFRFLILTGQRRSEVAKMKWAHVDGDLWTLPKASTKSRRIHDVPLSGNALELLQGLPRFEGSYVFSTTSGDRPVSGFSKAKTALDKAILEQRTEEAKKAGKDPGKVKGLGEWHLHDLRRTMTTWLANNGVLPHVLASLLNHTPGSTLGITAIYARSRWAKEKGEALAKWSKYVVSLEEKAANETKSDCPDGDLIRLSSGTG